MVLKRSFGALAVLVLAFFAFQYIWSYETTTHAGISNEMVELYNLSFKRKVSDAERELIVQGSVDEDSPATRVINHFYDPVRNVGLLGGHSAKEWAINPELQKQSVVGGGDFSWPRIVQDYAEGNERRALLGLGHILHLIEDAAVPDHTRNDSHLKLNVFGLVVDLNTNGSPYEGWAAGKTRETLAGLGKSVFGEGTRPKAFSTPGEYFDFMAGYTNKNFFSRDTIKGDPYANYAYAEPEATGYDGRYGYGIDSISGEKSKLVLLKKDESVIKKILVDGEDFSVLEEYFSRLSKQAVLTGAGVIDLFFKEAEVARAGYLKQLKVKQEQEAQENRALAHYLNTANIFELVASGFTYTFIDPIVNPLVSASQTAWSFLSESTAKSTQAISNVGLMTGFTTKLLANLTGVFIEEKAEQIAAQVQEGITFIQQNPAILAALSPFLTVAASESQLQVPAQALIPFEIPSTETTALVSVAISTEPIIVEAATSTPEAVTPPPPVYTGSAWVSGISPDAVAAAEEENTSETETTTTTEETTTTTEETATSTDETATTTPEVVAYDPNPVVINEIAWMGTLAQANDEWIELYNRTGQDIDLTGWTLESKNQRPLIALSGVIPARGYFLLERTNASTTDQVQNMTFTGALNNSGPDANLYLKNGTTTVDAVDFWNWPFENVSNQDKRTLERVSPYATSTLSYNWKTYSETLASPPFAKDAEGNDILGTPGAKNSVTGFYTPAGYITEDTTWRLAHSPYYVPIMIEVVRGATLTIEPGVAVKFAKGSLYGGGMNVHGTLRAEGAATSSIIFTSFSDDAADGVDSNRDGSASVPASADWMNVNFYGTTTDSVIRYAQIRYGGQGVNRNPNGWYPTYEGVVGVYGANPEISDSVFEHNHAVSVFAKDGAHPVLARNTIRNTVMPTYSGSPRNSFGVRVADASSTADILGNIFEQNTVGISSESAATTPLVVRENTFTNNQRNGEFNGYSNFNLVSSDNQDTNHKGGFYIRLLVSPGQSKTVTRDTMPYIIGAMFQVQAGGALTIEPGTILKSGNAPYGPAPVVVEGTLLARGTEMEPIVFTSTADEADGYDSDGRSMPPMAGAWKNIQFLGASSSDSILEYADVRYGGSGENICPYAYLAGPCMDYKGALYIQNASPAFVDSVFDNNQAIAVFIEGDSQPAIRRSRIKNTQTAPRNPRETIGGFGISIGAESAPALEDNTYEGNLENVVYR